MNFMINYPSIDENIELTLDGNQLYFDFEDMSRAANPRMWMPNKYG